MIEHFRADARSAAIGERLWCYSRDAWVAVATVDGWPRGTLTDRGGAAGMGAILNGDLLVAVIVDAEVAVADRYGLDVSTVHKYRHDLDRIRRRETKRRQSASAVGRDMRAARVARHPPRGRRVEMVMAITADRAAGMTISECAEKYGISRSTAWRLCR